MVDPLSVVAVAPGWAVAAIAILGALAVSAAMLEGALVARAEGARGGATGGLARPWGEAARLLRQRRRTTVAADSLLWRIGGAGLLVTAALMVGVVPLGEWTILDLDVGVMWFNAMDVMVWALVWLTGWGANSAHSLVGGYRFLAHGLGYELPLMFALVAPAIAAESLNVGQVAAAQAGLWFAVWMPVAFLVYLLCVAAFSVWGPFAPAIGSDIAGGARAELSGVDRLVFEAGRYALLAAGAAFAVPMFLGGGAGPLLPAWVWTLVKAAALLVVLVWLRHRLPAFRPDKFMEVGWLVLLPAVLLQDLVVAVVAVRGGVSVVSDIAFWGLGAVAVLSGAAVFYVDSMARATYALALSFVAVGVQVLFLQQNYVGVVTILMMVMEMAVMAVYMVMFMGMNPALMPMSMVHGNKVAVGVAVATFLVLAAGILLVDWPDRRGSPPPDVTRALGEALMGPKMLVMAVISPVMVATIVAGVVLAAHRTRYDRFGDDLKQRPADDPQPGGVGR